MSRRSSIDAIFCLACFLSSLTSHGAMAGVGDPKVSLIYPPPNVSIRDCSNIRLLASAQSDGAPVKIVEFFVSSNLVGTATAPPYQIFWRACPDTTKPYNFYTIRAVATDTLGRSNEASVEVLVIQAPGPATFETTSPTNGVVIAAPATVTLSAVLRHTDGADSPAGFYLGTNLVGLVTEPPYELTVSNLSVGDYTFHIGVTNLAGLVGGSPPVNFRVDTFTDNPPSVRIVNLPVNSGFIAPATIRFRAEADDPDGRVASVQFLEGTNVIGTATAAPFTFVWTNVPARGGFISAIATDELGVGTQSRAITLSVASASEIPVFSITQPSSHSHFPPGSPVTIQAEITSDNNLNPVEFFSRTNFLGSAPEWPYVVTVTNFNQGSHFLWARQKTLSGKAGRSPTLDLIVGDLGLVDPSFSQSGFQADVVGNITGKTVAIQSSTNLFDWVPINPTRIQLQIGTNDVIQIIDAQAVKYPFRFYRALLE